MKQPLFEYDDEEDEITVDFGSGTRRVELYVNANKVASLRAEVEALRQDAERYRWIKAQEILDLRTSGTRWSRPDGSTFVCSHILSANDKRYGAYQCLDQLMDAALRGEGEK